MPKCPKCGVEMGEGRHRSSYIRYDCDNPNCPVFGIRGRSKIGKDGKVLWSSGQIVFDSTYRGVNE